MLALITKLKLFFSNKIVIYVLLGIAAIIAIIAILNADTILTKFGFETKTTLAKEVVKTTEQLKTAVDVNKDLNKKIDDIKDTNKTVIETITFNNDSKQKTHEKIKANLDKANKARYLLIKEDKPIVIEPKVEDNEGIKLKIDTNIESYDKEMIHKYSKVTIDLINNTYKDLFGS